MIFILNSLYNLYDIYILLVYDVSKNAILKISLIVS